MRVAVDLRPLQSASRVRGIGTYLRELVLAFLEQEHDLVFLAWPGREVDLPIPEGSEWFYVPAPRPRVLGWLRDRFLLAERFRVLASRVRGSPSFGWTWAGLKPSGNPAGDGLHMNVTPRWSWWGHTCWPRLSRQARALSRAEGLLAISAHPAVPGGLPGSSAPYP